MFISLRLLFRKLLIWTSGEPRLRFVDSLKACMAGTRAVRMRGVGGIASIITRLRLVNSIDTFIEKIIDLEFWRAQAQASQFP